MPSKMPRIPRSPQAGPREPHLRGPRPLLSLTTTVHPFTLRPMKEKIALGAAPVTLEMVYAIAHGAPVELAPVARQRVQSARDLVENLAAGEKPVYGVTTGFGALAEVKVPKDQLKALQRNLILSHSAGVGRPLSKPETRAMMFVLRSINRTVIHVARSVSEPVGSLRARRTQVPTGLRRCHWGWPEAVASRHNYA